MSTSRSRSELRRALYGFTCIAGVAVLAAGCQADPTRAVVVNDLAAAGAEPMTVYKVWYRSTLYLDPVTPGTQSEALLVGAGTDYAYALLTPPYDPEVGPTRLVPARTREVVRTEPGDTSRLVFSTATAFVGCGDGGPLSREDSDFITQRIFPGAFADVTYDPTTCASTPVPGPTAATADAGDAGDTTDGD